MATKKTAAAPAAPRFEGFADTKMAFFHALDQKQEREWFQAHKGEFEKGWSEPMIALLDEVRGAIATPYKGVALRDPKVFRLQRDVRFGLDKTPYKTNVSGVLSMKGKGAAHETPAVVYLQLGVETFGGAGMYAMMGDSLDRFRAAVIDARKGAAIAKITEALVEKGYRLDAMETLKTAPRGVEKDHPRIELLKRKGLVAMFPAVPVDQLTSREFVTWVTERAVECAPLVRWLAQNVL